MTHGVLPIVRLALLKYAFTRLCQEGEAVCDLLHMELTPAEPWAPAYHPAAISDPRIRLPKRQRLRSVCRRISGQVLFIINAQRRRSDRCYGACAKGGIER